MFLIELDPGYATGRLFYRVYLTARGDFKNAQLQLDQAAQIDPLTPIIALCRGYPAAFQGDTQAGIRAAKEALGISPGFPAALEDLMTYFDRDGRRNEALQLAVALLHSRNENELAEVVETTGRRSGYSAALRVWFEGEEDRAHREYVSPLRIAILAIRVGEIDKAFYWMTKAVDDRNAGLVYLKIDPKYAPLRSDLGLRK